MREKGKEQERTMESLIPTSQPEFANTIGMLFAPQQGVCELTDADRNDILRLLAQDTLRGLHLRGMIEENGVCHPSHRGHFFGYYENGELKNIALLGHFILIYRHDVGLAHFAEKAAEIQAPAYLVLGPTTQVETFWNYFAQYGRETRMARPQFWYVCRRQQLQTPVMQLELAGRENFEEIVATQAELVKEQSGVDPRERDPEGFRQRVMERIERGRTWVVRENDKVIFKVELISDTESAVYLESIWTHPDYRGRGIATTSLNELLRIFVQMGKVVAILVEPEEEAARRIYERLGFNIEEDYQARFLKPRS
jgi:ribosomal protein S18 acetylase RimI-like enzyme